jgi:glycosyltransferase EpsJ
MNEPKVSIIMPVYGVEKYVGRAIESILNQTYTNFEFFCVDDGSPDKSGEICDEYAKKDGRIIVIHKENGGAPSARNAAIDRATGKYMYFMDSDDWTEKTMLADMVEIAENNSSQLVVAGYYIDTYYSETEKFTQEQAWVDKVFVSQQEFRENAHTLFDLNLLYTPWNKLFSADYIKQNGLYFPNTFWDDFPFNLSVIRDIESVAVTSKKYYHFIRQRAESETAKYRSDMYEKREEENGWLIDLYNHWKIKNGAVEEFLARRYVERLIGCIENVTNKNCTLSSGEKRGQIKMMISSPTAVKALKTAKPKSMYMKLMLIPVRMKSVSLTFLEGKVISFVKSGDTKLFAKLKAGR